MNSRIRRALLFMPGDSRKKIEKGASLGVDSIIMDLEDAIAFSGKEAARQCTLQALREVDFGRSERLVRLNQVIPGWLYADDLAATIDGQPDGYVLPKVEDPAQVQHVADLLAEAEDARGWPHESIRLLAIIETGKGVVNLREIVTSHPRLDALIFGAEDLAGDIGAQRTRAGWEVFYARSAVVTYAKAFGLQAIDTVFVDLTAPDEALIEETQLILNMGYTGKLAIHPRQVGPIQQVFTPRIDEVRAARQLIAAHEAHQDSGLGVFEYQGKMVDMPMIRSALILLARARACGLDVDAL
ncbi:MAG: CoA ester lyase [Anaerolineae bacterium]|nr:CoA ester lyase [Anaerolineae bacterium]MDW8173533.1 CoA ester lyase [Anaerolineae bacterium]